MIQPQTLLNVADNSGAQELMCIRRPKLEKNHLATKSLKAQARPSEPEALCPKLEAQKSRPKS
ncbi:50S ribosomal protein L14, chloroplastic [Apostasia shenzhenica]|uniref:50S ribosomal protein L14, chloroplastic n=1 Tax=Apostasia shenzhenica TaxID=1088818 RepID=A0A2I0BB24_9ASPA|nr:50S ribosomal protein L14, chloroplastic [Apostasia shenzhenica]